LPYHSSQVGNGIFSGDAIVYNAATKKYVEATSYTLHQMTPPLLCTLEFAIHPSVPGLLCRGELEKNVDAQTFFPLQNGKFRDLVTGKVLPGAFVADKTSPF
jgi:hypothetical protein